MNRETFKRFEAKKDVLHNDFWYYIYDQAGVEFGLEQSWRRGGSLKAIRVDGVDGVDGVYSVYGALRKRHRERGG